ncbi:MAG TPA: DoxX family protein [Bdellovibrionales bacterium]|nr:DoxX family protein [Bdellovibrionales bacterium]
MKWSKWGQFTAWLGDHRENFVDLFRAYLGVALFIKGLYFASHTSMLHDTLGAGGISMGQAALAHVIPALHIFGGALLAIGLLTRFAALIQIPILFGAVFLIHSREGLFSPAPNLELAGLVLIGLILIAAHGPGRMSADHFVFSARGSEDNLIPWRWRARVFPPDEGHIPSRQSS